MTVKKYDTYKLKVHPLNEALVPPMTPKELEALKCSIEEHGQKEPIILDSATGKVVDGRNRLTACKALGIDEILGEEREFKDEAEMIEFILLKPAEHRHLTKSQKAALAAQYVLHLRGTGLFNKGRPSEKNPSKVTEFPDHEKNVITHEETELETNRKLNQIKPQKNAGNLQDNQKNAPEKKVPKVAHFSEAEINPQRARELAAKKFGVSHSYIQIALNLHKVSPESFQQVLHGEMTIKQAEEFLAKLKLDKTSEGLIPELEYLAEKRKLSPGAAYHLAQLPPDDQRLLLELVGSTLIESMTAGDSQRYKLVVKKTKDDKAFQELKTEILELRKAKKSLISRLQASKDTIKSYEAELENLRQLVKEDVGGQDAEAAARIEHLEHELENLKKNNAELVSQIQTLEEEKEDLTQKYLNLEEVAEKRKERLQDIHKKIKKFTIRKGKRGRKKKTYFMREIERIERQKKALEAENRKIYARLDEFRKIILGMEKRHSAFVNRTEASESLNALRLILGTLETPAIQRLPDDMADERKNIVEALEVLQQIIEKVVDVTDRLLEEADIVIKRVHKELANYPTTKHLYKNGKRIIN